MFTSSAQSTVTTPPLYVSQPVFSIEYQVLASPSAWSLQFTEKKQTILIHVNKAKHKYLMYGNAYMYYYCNKAKKTSKKSLIKLCYIKIHGSTPLSGIQVIAP